MTTAMTDRMTAIAREVAPAHAEIVPLTADRGFPYIASRAEAQVAGAIMYEMIAPHAGRVDAAIVAITDSGQLDELTVEWLADNAGTPLIEE